MREIVFTGRADLPSFQMLGDQVSREMKKRGFQIRLVTNANEWQRIYNSIVVIVKYPLGDIQSLKQHGNTIIFHVVDRFVRPRDLNGLRPLLEQMDRIIVTHTTCAIAVQEIMMPHKCIPSVIPHHSDPRIVGIRSAASTPLLLFKIGYLGDFGSIQYGLLYSHRLVCDHNISILDTNSGRDVTAEYKQRGTIVAYPSNPNAMKQLEVINFSGISAQISIRQPMGPESQYKPGVKVATAAAMKMPLLTTRDAATLELLPPNYPYFVNSASWEDVSVGIVFMRKTWQKREWQQALEMLEVVDSKTRLAGEVGDKFATLFNTLRM